MAHQEVTLMGEFVGSLVVMAIVIAVGAFIVNADFTAVATSFAKTAGEYMDKAGDIPINFTGKPAPG
ncbi:MAG: hypothetical protein ACRCYQ_06060 [Nocardioides sp.]